ncbi:MAG: hypothetical protein WBQ86_06835 [Candidatus Binatus sp.]
MHQNSIAIVAWVARSERDLTIAFVFAIIGAICWDVIKTGSVAGVRQIRNKLSEQSVARLRGRIVQLEMYRDVINSYLSSDRAMYLATLRLMFGILMFLCIGALAVILDYFLQSSGPRFSLLAVAVLIIAVAFGAYGVQLSGLDTRSKLSEKIATLDAEINDLKAKLDIRIQKTAD